LTNSDVQVQGIYASVTLAVKVFRRQGVRGSNVATSPPSSTSYAGFVFTQLYTMQSVEEAVACVEAGVDHLGLTPIQGLPGEIPLATMRAIVEAVGDSARCVLLTVRTDPYQISAMVAAVRPAILHLCPLARDITPATVASLRAHLPAGLPIMQAVSVTGPESVDEARAYAEVADYLILDTQAPDIPGVGASGMTHDWSISRAIVEAVRVPVILAGGLSPENVGAAIRAVRPWGVDSLTHTNRLLPGGGFRKDLAKVRAFIAAARAADA
jgi:phosphoribosylanthranilate isomerase